MRRRLRIPQLTRTPCTMFVDVSRSRNSLNHHLSSSLVCCCVILSKNIPDNGFIDLVSCVFLVLPCVYRHRGLERLSKKGKTGLIDRLRGVIINSRLHP